MKRCGDWSALEHLRGVQESLLPLIMRQEVFAIAYCPEPCWEGGVCFTNNAPAGAIIVPVAQIEDFFEEQRRRVVGEHN